MHDQEQESQQHVSWSNLPWHTWMYPLVIKRTLVQEANENIIRKKRNTVDSIKIQPPR